MKETFGQRLQRLRKEKGLTQEEIASQITISPQAVSKWENDNSEPDLDTLNKLADIFNCSVDELLGREVPKQEEVHQDDDAEVEDAYVETEEDKEAKFKEKVEAFAKRASEAVVETSEEIKRKKRHKDEQTFWITTGSLFGLALVAFILMGIFWKDKGMGWKMGWLVFLLPPIFSSLGHAIIKRKFTRFAYPILIVFTYLLLGYLADYLGFEGWGVYWFLFITIPAYYMVFGPIDRYFRKKYRKNHWWDDDDDEDDDDDDDEDDD